MIRRFITQGKNSTTDSCQRSLGSCDEIGWDETGGEDVELKKGRSVKVRRGLKKFYSHYLLNICIYLWDHRYRMRTIVCVSKRFILMNYEDCSYVKKKMDLTICLEDDWIMEKILWQQSLERSKRNYDVRQ